MSFDASSFAERIIDWQRKHGRHGLPWQNTRDPYRIWISEIMLQQTQVAAVIPYYERFMQRFPDVGALADASEDEVLSLWSGLGYYARGRNLHRAARCICEQHAGMFHIDFDDVLCLPGIGRSTAAAICVFARGAHQAILDGNVKRVLARHRAIAGFPGETRVAQQLWECAQAALPDTHIEAYTQGLMDLGASVCTRRAPRCAQCPVSRDCIALEKNLIDALPAPRPARPLPQKQTCFAVLLDGSDVFLQKRPAPGIWGGLWCFPEIAGDNVAGEAARFVLEIGEVTRLTPIEHGFTHFRLRIHPVLLRVAQRACGTAETGAEWVSVKSALRYPIPAPVRILLELLCGTDGESANQYSSVAAPQLSLLL